MKGIPTSTLHDSTYFDKPVYLDPGYILLTPDSPVTEDLVKKLRKWKYDQVLTDGRTKDVPSYLSGAGAGTLAPQTIDEDIREVEHIAAARKFYSELRTFTSGMFTQVSTEGTLNMASVTDWVKRTIQMVRECRDCLLSAIEMDGGGDDYLVSHSVNSTVISMIIGEYLKAPPHRLIELGNACMLHEVGMLRLPVDLRRSKLKLSDEERRAMVAHTLFGYRILKGFSAPENVALAALEHHERMDGSGYPRGLPAEKITEYARIIAVTCSYDAIVSRRPFRASIVDGHYAIRDLLQKNRKQYDDRVLKALVYTMSVYPVGTSVLLGNGSKGVVVRTDPDKPRCPIVKVLRDPDGKKLESPPLVQTAESSESRGIPIARVLSAEEAGSLRS